MVSKDGKRITFTGGFWHDINPWLIVSCAWSMYGHKCCPLPSWTCRTCLSFSAWRWWHWNFRGDRILSNKVKKLEEEWDEKESNQITIIK